MKRLFMISLLSLCLLFLTTLSIVFAKGIPSYYTFEGENLPMIYLRLDQAIVFDSLNRLESVSEQENAPYILRSYYHVEGEVLESQLSPIHYYPQEDGSGLIYFVGARDRGVYQEFDGRWYQALPEFSRIFNRYIDIANFVDILSLHLDF